MRKWIGFLCHSLFHFLVVVFLPKAMIYSLFMFSEFSVCIAFSSFLEVREGECAILYLFTWQRGFVSQPCVMCIHQCYGNPTLIFSEYRIKMQRWPFSLSCAIACKLYDYFRLPYHSFWALLVHIEMSQIHFLKEIKPNKNFFPECKGQT